MRNHHCRHQTCAQRPRERAAITASASPHSQQPSTPSRSAQGSLQVPPHRSACRHANQRRAVGSKTLIILFKLQRSK
ncbi:hypothetical protein VNO80_23130 [Phaseolus coccineus]|uniref:Uncharacterized protein n=1 Tax=Phaseolus coccineus TaxID=3886 RepID=A0AAN9M658_PHACN